MGLSPALRSHLVASVTLAGVVAAAVLTQAEAIARLLPRLIDGDGSAVAPLVGWLVVAGAVRALAAALTERSATLALVTTRGEVRRRVLDRLAVLRLDQRADLGPAQVATLTTTASDALEPWVRSYLPGLMLAVVVPLAAGARILGADVLSAVILAVVVPLVPIFMVLIGVATELQAARQWDALQRLANRFLDVITGLPTLRLFGRAEAQVERVREVTERYRLATMGTLRVAFLSALVLELLATLSVAVVAVSLGVRLAGGHLGLTTALVVLLLAPECLLPIRRVSAAFHAATAGVDAARAVEAVLELPVRAVGGASVGPGPAGPLVARGITVTDPERGVRLARRDLVVSPGELVAVTGPSGSGKSTLLDVLRGALEPDAGSVALGSVAIADLSLAGRAAALAWVPQRPQPLGATVQESAALGHESDALAAVAVTEVLQHLGLDAMATAAPAELSGGELRRLGTARALVGAALGSASVLLLDEPTAQLDERASAKVTEAIQRAAASGVAVVVATHDERVMALADRCIHLAPITADTAPAPDSAAHPPAVVAAPAERRSVRPPPVPDPVRGWASGAGHVTGPMGGPDRSAANGVRWLLAAARPRWGRLAGAQALGVLTEMCTVGLSATAAWLIVRAAERPSFADLAVAAVAVRAFGLGKGVLRYAERLASHDATLRLLADLRATVVERLTHLAPTGLPTAGRGELLARLVDDVDRLQDLFLRVITPLVAGLVASTAAVVACALIDGAGGAVLAVAVAVSGIGLPLVAHRVARRRGAAAAAARGAVTAAVVDLAEHVEELVAVGAEPSWRARIEARATVLDAIDRRMGWTTALVTALSAAAPALATAAVVAAAGPAGTGLSGPALGVLVLLPVTVMELLAPLAAAGEALARVEASAGRVWSLLDRRDPVPEPAVPPPPPRRGDLDLDDVAVGWPGGPVVRAGVNLSVAEGERAVVSGPSGSGKSTLAAALVAFLTPMAGVYRVGGALTTGASGIGGDATRRLVTWCQQDPWFADSTLGDNLRVADPTATDEALWAALEVVHLDGWTRRLPAGLDTRLARDATAMSGGERQRLALARALLGGQRAIVLDEPTSHLDRPTAEAVLRDLLEATADRSVVLISHDPTTTGS